MSITVYTLTVVVEVEAPDARAAEDYVSELLNGPDDMAVVTIETTASRQETY